MKSNEELNKAIDNVLLEQAPLNAKGRITVRELILDAIEQAGFVIVGKDTLHSGQAIKAAEVPRKHPTDYLKSRSDGNDHPNGGRFEGQDER